MPEKNAGGTGWLQKKAGRERHDQKRVSYLKEGGNKISFETKRGVATTCLLWGLINKTEAENRRYLNKKQREEAVSGRRG